MGESSMLPGGGGMKQQEKGLTSLILSCEKVTRKGSGRGGESARALRVSTKEQIAAL